jgi:protein gp37
MKLAVGRCPASGAALASQSTISRLENAPSKTEAARLAAALLDHIWMGVSIEDGNRFSRLQHLTGTNAPIKFLSLEPLIGRIGRLDLRGISRVIAGGESGLGHRPVDPEWVREIRDQCNVSGIAFFFKQWGGKNPKSGGRELDGIEWNQYPTMLSQKGSFESPRYSTSSRV